MKVKVKSLSRVRLLVTPWTAAHQAPLPMGFSRQEYWSGVQLPSPCKYLPNAYYPGIVQSKEGHRKQINVKKKNVKTRNSE